MTATARTRPFLATVLAAAVGSCLAATLVAPAEAAPDRRVSPPDRVELPDGFQPEGIEARGPIAYLGS